MGKVVGLVYEKVEKGPSKKEQLMERLTELGVEFKKDMKVGELEALLPKD